MNDAKITPLGERELSINEVAFVAGVPSKDVSRSIRKGLLGDAVKHSKRSKAVLSKGLVGFVGVRLDCDMAEILTPEGRRRLIRHLLGELPLLEKGRAEVVPHASVRGISGEGLAHSVTCCCIKSRIQVI